LLSKYAKKEEESLDKIVGSLFEKVRSAYEQKSANLASLLQSLNSLVAEDFEARKLIISTGVSSFLLDIIGADLNTQKEEPSKWVGNALLVLDSLVQVQYPSQKEIESKVEKDKTSTGIAELMALLPMDQNQMLSKLIFGNTLP
jgi:hypothetical protein